MKKIYNWFYAKFGWQKEEVDQYTLIAGILLFVFVLLALFVFLTPGMNGVAVILAKYFVYIFEGVGFLVLGLWFIGHYVVRPFIEFLDEIRASSIDDWWLLADPFLQLGLVCGRIRSWSFLVVGSWFSYVLFWILLERDS